MPVFSFAIHRTGSEESLEHAVGDCVRISETTKGKGSGCRGTVQKITKSYTFILAENSRGEVRAQHRFIELVEKKQSGQSDLIEFRVRTEEDKTNRARQAEERQERVDQAERTRQAEEEGRERKVAAARTQAREMGRETDILNEILRNQEYIMEKLRALDVKQEMLTIEARNSHVLVTDIQMNVQEIRQHLFNKLQGQVKAVCRHLPMIRQNMHDLIGTDQKLAAIANKVGVGAEEEFYSVTGVEEHHEKMDEF